MARTKAINQLNDDNHSAEIASGTVVGQYEVLRLLGSGGMAQVYLARDIELGRRVALKFIDPGSVLAQGSDEFVREARTLAQFNHPNIITIFGAGSFASAPYIAMEFVEGDTLRARMQHHTLSMREAQRLALGVAQGLEEAHRSSVIHGDLKPENIVISRDGRVRILDFGLARLFHPNDGDDRNRYAPSDAVKGLLQIEVSAEAPSSTHSSSMRGTPDYMAPEQWRGEVRTPALDVWAFGVLLYELLTGRRPVQEATLLALCQTVISDEAFPSVAALRELPEPLVKLVDGCLDKRANQRPSASQCALVLSQLVHGIDAQHIDSSEAPFRGLSAFTEEHASFFFGRDDDVAAFIERLRTEVVLPIVGASGVGKSSFIQAGVIPRLREQGEWRVLRIRPGADPFRALATRFVMSKSASRMRHAERATAEPSFDVDEAKDEAGINPADLARELYDNPKKLALLLRAEAKVQSCSVLLLVDQLEEACTLVADQETRMRFFAAICNAADDASERTRVVFTVRDDFLSRLAESPDARAALTRVMVLRAPGDDALRQILERPLQVVGYRYDDHELVTEMISAVKGEASALPLLQFCGSMLWDRRNLSAHTLDRSAYLGIGGVQGALATHADSFMRDLRESQSRMTRAVLLRLVTPEGTRRVTSKRSLLESFGSDVEDVLLKLSSSRLLSVRDVFDEPHYELSHESLVHTWDRLRTWLEEGREELVFLAEVEQASVLWDKRGRRASEVWTSRALAEALRSLDRYNCRLPVLADAFVEASKHAERRRVAVRRTIAALGVLALVTVAVVSIVTAVRFAEKTKVAQTQRAAAQAEAARSAFLKGDFISARAQLRSSFMEADSAAVRGLLSQLEEQQVEWKRTLPSPLYDLAISPDGREVAAAAVDHTVYLINRYTGVTTALRGHADQVLGVAYSPDGSSIASCDMFGSIFLWNRSDGSHRELKGSEGPSWKLSFSSDGRFLAAGGLDGHVRVWTTRDGSLHRSWSFEGPVNRVVFHPRSNVLAVGTSKGPISLVDPNEASPIAELVGAHTATIYALAFNHDGSRLVSGSEDRQVAVWDVNSRLLLRKWQAADSAVTSVAFDNDGQHVLSASYEPALKIWDVKTGNLLRTATEHTSGVVAVALSDDGAVVTAGQSDKQVVVWNLSSAGSSAHSAGHKSPVQLAIFSPDGAHIFSSGDDSSVLMWDARTGEVLRAFTDATDTVMSLSVRAAAKDRPALLATGSVDRKIRIYDLTAKKLVSTLEGHENGVYGTAFSEARVDTLYSAGFDATVREWSLSQKRQLHSITVPAPIVTALFGKSIAVFSSMSAGHFIVRLDPLTLLDVRKGEGWGVALAPDEDTYAIGSLSGEVTTFNRAGAQLSKDKISDVGLYRGAFDPSGTHVAFAGRDHARIWPVAKPKQTTNILGHLGETSAIRFDSSGKLVATAGDDGTVRVWDPRTGEPVWHARVALSYSGEVLSHMGWRTLGGLPVSLRPLHAALATARFAESSNQIGCALLGRGNSVLVWPTSDESARVEVPVEQARDLRARGDACVVGLASGQTLTIDHSGHISAVETPGLPDGVTALCDGGGWVAQGYSNGTIEVYEKPSGIRRALDFQQQPSGSVIGLTPGPAGTLFASYSGGGVGLWALRDGARLAAIKLHGPAKWFFERDGRYHAISVLGDMGSIDARTLEQSYCAVRSRIEASVHVVWRDGLLQFDDTRSACQEDHR